MAGGLNLYGYAAGDPINGSDPFGLDPSYDLIVRYVAGEIGGGSARNQEAISTLANEATQRAVRALINRSAIVGVTLVIADAYRSIAAQNDLYMIGRSSYCDSDFFCLIDSRKTVTNATGGSSWHNFGFAVDVYPLQEGRINWNATRADYEPVVKIGIALGFEWGGNWKSQVDKPHFQRPDGRKLSDMR